MIGGVADAREDRRTARRTEILDGARRCFGEFGYEGATVRRLEEATGLSRGAIFHHFRDKEAVFLALAEDDAARMADTVAEQGLVQVMRDVLSRPEDFDWLGTRMEMARRLRTEPDFRQRWLDRARELSSATGQRLRAQKEAGRLREDVPAEVVQVYLELVLDGLVSRLAAGYDTADLSAVLDMVEDSVRRRD